MLLIHRPLEVIKRRRCMLSELFPLLLSSPCSLQKGCFLLTPPWANLSQPQLALDPYPFGSIGPVSRPMLARRSPGPFGPIGSWIPARWAQVAKRQTYNNKCKLHVLVTGIKFKNRCANPDRVGSMSMTNLLNTFIMGRQINTAIFFYGSGGGG